MKPETKTKIQLLADAVVREDDGKKLTRDQSAAVSMLEFEATFPIFESMAQAASRLKVPLDVIKSRKRDGSLAFISGGRVDCDVLVPELFELLTAQAAGGGNEYLDAQQEQARLNKSKRAAQERENAEAEKLLIRRETAEEVLWEQGVQPIRAWILTLRQTVKRVDDVLQGAAAAQDHGTAREEVSKILNTAIDTGLAAVANSITEMI